MTTSVDLIVIGTGPAASTVAREANNKGKRVAIVEERKFGGTCALRGCNPKKVYTNAADLVDQARRADGKLARFGEIRINWPELLAFKREFTEPVIEKSEQSFIKDGISTYHGTASFVNPRQVKVGEVLLEASRILIATGARPRPLNIPGEELLISSDEFLELRELPRRVTFIGGGYISMEFSHVAARFGSHVTILESSPRVLSEFDPDLVEQLTNWSRETGIDIRAGSKAVKVEQLKNHKYVVTFDVHGKQSSLETDLVVHGAGRQPHIQGLNLKAAEVAFNDQGIKVDEYLRSVTNPAVFAAGDCAATGMPRLTPTANEEARAVVKNLFTDAPTKRPHYGAIPQVCFTAPAIAAVGMDEETIRSGGADVDVLKDDTSDWGSVRKTTQECAGYKILVDKKSDLILGAHLLGPRAEEVINLFTLAIRYNLTATQLKSTLFAFPTFGSDVRNMV